MKVWKKLQVVFLALLLCTGMMTQPALAASLLQDGIEAALTTDKETYQQGEEIKVTLTVTNTNDTAVTNLSLENILPENLCWPKMRRQQKRWNLCRLEKPLR